MESVNSVKLLTEGRALCNKLVQCIAAVAFCRCQTGSTYWTVDCHRVKST